MKIAFIQRKRITFYDLQPLSFKHGRKTSRGVPEQRFQMPAVQLKALLNVACKVVDNACTFFLGDRLNLYSDGCLQSEKLTPV